MEVGTRPTSPSKNPISLLQEACRRIGKFPTYDLLLEERCAIPPQFVFRCTVEDLVCMGQGRSKRSAKHASAEAVLKAFRAELAASEDADLPPEEPPMKLSPAKPTVTQDEADSKDPFDALKELVVGRGWRLPTYTLHTESGPCHAKEFVMCCAVESYKTFGSGAAKRVAKRNAAMTMSKKIQDLQRNKEPRLNSENEEKTMSFDVLLNSKGEKIGELPVESGCNLQEGDSCQVLETIAENLDFTVQYQFIDTSTLTGEFQCFIYLTTQPPLCAQSQGTSVDECRRCAAKNAIRMLKIFSE